MKDQELELQVAPMSNDTMEYLNVLLAYANALKQIITMQHRSSVNLLMQWLRTSTS